METLDDVLEHYGILGMRWGVRRTPEQLGRARAQRRKKGKPVTPTRAARREAAKSPDARAADAAKKKAKKGGGPSALSNQELQRLNARLNLEQQYSKLTDQPNRLQRGQNHVKEILGLGRTVNEVISFVNSPLGEQIKNQVVRSPTPPGTVPKPPKASRRRR